jgi:hypothetical protein
LQSTIGGKTDGTPFPECLWLPFRKNPKEGVPAHCRDEIAKEYFSKEKDPSENFYIINKIEINQMK